MRRQWNIFFKDMNELISKEKVDPNRSRLNQKHNISASEYLHNLIKDGRLIRILGSIGTRDPYSGLPLLAAMWNLVCNEGIWFPEEGMQSFCERFGKVLTGKAPHQRKGDKGIGEFQLNREVAKIRVDQGKVLGVVLKDGTQIDSPSVISNTDYKTAFLKLMEPKTIPPAWHDAVSAAKQTESIFQVCLGVDATKADLSAFKEADRIIYRRTQENVKEKKIDWNASEIDPDALASQEIDISLWGKDWRLQSSEGKAGIVIRAEADYNHFAKYRSGWRQRSPEYQGYKMRLAHTIIQEVEKLIPELSNAILVMDVATPLTFEDQGGRNGGAVAGWSWDYKDFRDDHPKELILTPIRGLYMAGYQAFSALFMGGVPTAMESGKRAAKAVLEGAGPIDKFMIPGTK